MGKNASDTSTPLLSIVSPVYKAEAIVDELVKRIKEEVSKITEDYEIVLIEDGSPDKSWEKIEEICKTEKRVKGIKLSRNFGQHYAITAGLAESKGEYVVVMDCDLQDNPKYIKELLDKAKEGYDIVNTVKITRKHSSIKNFLAGCFHRFFNFLLGRKELHGDAMIGAYSLITRKVVDAYASISDYYRPYTASLQWLGFSKVMIEVEHEERFAGRSSYTFFKLLSHAFNGIISQTDKLLRVSIYTGFALVALSFISILYIVIRSLNSGFHPGWASLAVLIIFSTGLMLMSLGIVGVYIGKIFEQTKNRPLYIIDKKIN